MGIFWLQTPAAAARIGELLAERPEASAVRIGVQRYGCNGLGFTLDYATGKSNVLDEVVEEHGAGD